MTTHQWNTYGTNIQGDLRVSLIPGNLYKNHIELYIVAYSEKWDKCNVALEYKGSTDDSWHIDTKIVTSSVDFIEGNRLFGLPASKSGSLTKIFWRYKANDLFDASRAKIRISILPRIKHFSRSITSALVSEIYGQNRVELDEFLNLKSIIGIDNEGHYIALDDDRIVVLGENGLPPIRSFQGVLGAKHAIQTYDGHYIVADTDNDRVLKLDSGLSSIASSYAVSKPQFIDYSEINDTMMVTSREPDKIYELIWHSDFTPNLLWSSNYGFEAPSSATYSKINSDHFIISDTNKHRVVIYEKLNNTYRDIDRSYVKDGESLKLFKPFRAYQFIDGDICVVESEGQRITWGPSGYGWYVGSAYSGDSFLT